MQVLGHFNTSVERALEEIDPYFRDLIGLVICGSHRPNELDIESLLAVITNARESGIPFLGICFGHQLAAIEYARNVLDIPDATSEEFADIGTFVVKKRPEGLKVGLDKGESYWSNYYVEMPDVWENPPHFFTTQSHPEYHSSKNRPHPLLIEFIEACKKR